MALVNPQIAMSYRPTTEYQPRNALAEYAQVQQIMGARTQQETAQMQQEALRVQMAKARRDEQAFDSWIQGIVEKGGPSDPMQATAEMIKTRNPELVSAGLKMRQAYIDAQRDREAMGLPPLSYGRAAAAPATTAPAPVGELVAPPIMPPTGTMQEIAPGGAVGAEMPLTRGAAAPVNALAPAAPAAAPAAPVNQLAAAMSPEEMRARTMLLSSNPGVREAGKAELAKLTAAHVVAPGGSLVVGGKPVYTAPAAAPQPTVLARLQSEMAALPPNDPRRVDYAALIRKETTHAPATTVNVSTEKKYGERFGGLIADRDAGKLDAAESAPRVIENADRITDILATGKVFTGTGANVRLQIAKALNLAGGTDTERIANTEVLISSLANSTLGAIKSSNLGAGQGFTNADRDFLEKAASGQITYDSTSLRRLAELGRKVGVASIESWNSRVGQMPKSALEGAGISTNPLPIPARRPSSVMNIPQGAIDMLKAGQGTREQFDAQFGPGSADRVLPKGK